MNYIKIEQIPVWLNMSLICGFFVLGGFWLFQKTETVKIFKSCNLQRNSPYQSWETHTDSFLYTPV
jgi:hypothetical protein